VARGTLNNDVNIKAELESQIAHAARKYDRFTRKNMMAAVLRKSGEEAASRKMQRLPVDGGPGQ